MAHLYEGKILKLSPGATYQGKRYDQNVFFELEDHRVLKLFDQKLICTPHAVGKKIKLKISTLDSAYPEKHKTRKIRQREKKIVIDKGYDIFGEVMDKTQIDKGNFEEYCLDVGVGFVFLSEKKNAFNIGDYAYAHASRLDIDKILG